MPFRYSHGKEQTRFPSPISPLTRSAGRPSPELPSTGLLQRWQNSAKLSPNDLLWCIESLARCRPLYSNAIGRPGLTAAPAAPPGAQDFNTLAQSSAAGGILRQALRSRRLRGLRERRGHAGRSTGRGLRGGLPVKLATVLPADANPAASLSSLLWASTPDLVGTEATTAHEMHDHQIALPAQPKHIALTP